MIRRSARILVVDDDRQLLESLVDILKDAGYSPLSAGTVKLARALLQTPELDLVLADYELPDGNGVEIAHEVHKAFPHIPFLLMSGHVTADWIEAHAAEAVRQFLPKPVLPDVLLEAVAQALRH